jgi:hypothetical protein
MVEIKGYKYKKADFIGIDFETFVTNFSETFKDCDLESTYKLLTGRNPDSLKSGKDSKPGKKAGKVQP